VRRPAFRKTRLRLLPLVGVLVLLLAAAGHVVYWYLPRERAVRPRAGDLPARLLASDTYDAVLWLPYPHQNLGVLEESVGDSGAWLAAAARWGGAEEVGESLAWPGFGPFRAPPSRELAAAVGKDGVEVLAARVYPALALVARLAGKVAGNPWLAGGEVEVDGRPATVAWDGGLWTVVRDGASVPGDGPAEQQTPEPLLAAVRLVRPAGDALPAGLYALTRRDGDLTLATAGSEAAAPVWPDSMDSDSGDPVSLALLRGPAGVDDGETPALLLLFGGMDGGLLGLPGAAVLYPPAAPGEKVDRLELPHERLPSVLRRELPRGEAGGLRVVASGRSALAAAEALAPEVASRLTLRGTAPVLALRLDPGPTLALLDDVVGTLEDLPLVSKREVRRWRDARTVLRPLGGFSDVRAEVLEVNGDRHFRLILIDSRSPVS
jgi:hypothetical protein